MTNLMGWLEKLQGYATQIGWGVCLLCVIILSVVFFTGGANGAQGGKKWAINILLGIAVLSFGVSIVLSLKG